MAGQKQLSWFLTSTGRKFSYLTACTVGCAALVCQYAPQTIGISHYVDVVHFYKNGVKETISPEVNQRFKKCLDILGMNDIQKKIIKPFVVFGYDLFHAGTTSSKFGVSIGIPDNFNYKSELDIDKDDIQINMKPVNWTSDAGEKLADALVLPEKLQIFGICREILMADSLKVYLDCVAPGSIILLSYAFGRFVNEKMNFYARPASLRYTLYSLISLFSVGLYFLAKDLTQIHYETKVDRKLAELGPDFAESGVQFYNKILKRNMALRHFMGAEGAKVYSPLGNENFLIRHKRTPVTLRKQFFEIKLKEYLENDQAKDQETVPE